MKKAIEAVLAANWAIIPDWLDTIASIAERESEYSGNLQALEAKLGRPLGNTMTASVRDGVAVIPIEGPMFRRANLMTAFSGASSYDVMALDLAQALADPMVDAVLLNIDSPGGEVNGASELAQMIASADKPVWAYVGGTGASAAYWIASAADKIIAADTAILGSIGVLAGYTIRDGRPGERSITFISSQSPMKNASPETEAGAKQIQANVDALAQVFVATIAKNRSISETVVLESFGAGAVFVAAEAEKRGMIDGISTFEQTLQSLRQEIETMDYDDLTVAGLTENRADLVAAITASAIAGVEKVDQDALRAEGAAAERARIEGIEALALPGTETLIAKFKADGTKPEVAAMEILKAAKAGGLAGTGAQHITGLQQTEVSLVPPAAGPGTDQAQTTEEAATAAVQLARSAGIEA